MLLMAGREIPVCRESPSCVILSALRVLRNAAPRETLSETRTDVMAAPQGKDHFHFGFNQVNSPRKYKAHFLCLQLVAHRPEWKGWISFEALSRTRLSDPAPELRRPRRNSARIRSIARPASRRSGFGGRCRQPGISRVFHGIRSPGSPAWKWRCKKRTNVLLVLSSSRGDRLSMPRLRRGVRT